MRTYGRLRASLGKWVLSDLEPHVAIKLKAVFPKVPKYSRGPFVFPADHATAADLAWFISRYPLAASPEDLMALQSDRIGFEAIQAEVGRIMSMDYEPPSFSGLREGQTVRLHQAQNCELLSRFCGLLVADDVGEGKTYTAGAACLLPGALPATIVCPPHLAIQWSNKLREFTTLSTHIVSRTKPYALPPVDVRIFGYTQLAGWIDVLELLGTGLAAFDEGHELRRGGVETAKGAAAQRLAEVSRLRLMLTATPVFNYGDEIWNLMQFVRPEVLGDWGDFQREWCSGRTVSDPKALGTYLREQHAMTRRLGQGPKPNRIVETIPHDVDRLASVAEAMRALAYTIVHGTFEESGRATRELDMRLRQETGIAKAPFVAKYVRALVEAGEPVMLFGWHRDVYDIWLAELGDLGVVMFTGSESPAEKNKAKARFLDGEARVFIMSLRSGAGLDGLQHCCSTVVFGELDWSGAMHDQCIGRVNREGQRVWPEPVNAIFLVTDDGSDPPIMEVLGIKASQAAGIVDPSAGPQVVVADRKPIERLIARYLPEVAA